MNYCYWLDFGSISEDNIEKLISFCQLHKNEVVLLRYGPSFGSVLVVMPWVRLIA